MVHDKRVWRASWPDFLDWPCANKENLGPSSGKGPKELKDGPRWRCLDKHGPGLKGLGPQHCEGAHPHC